ncbi:MAG: hypothetical protein ACJ71F_01960, partial [Nitrososphaeraceae archaeon]
EYVREDAHINDSTIARHWALLASFLKLSFNGIYKKIDGFQLRQTSDWVVPSSGHPSEIYEYLGRT